MSFASTGPQDYRAIAILNNSAERLLCIGETSSEVEQRYTEAWMEVIRDEDRPNVASVAVQKWTGEVLGGKWVHHKDLSVPDQEVSQ